MAMLKCWWEPKHGSRGAIVRITTLLRRLVGVMSMFVTAFRWEGDCLVLSVRPAWKRPRCGECKRRAPGYDRKHKPRRWRALSWGTVKVFLEYAVRRVECPRCEGVRVEQVPWAAHGSWFTRPFEELIAYYAQGTDKTRACKMLGVSWEAVCTAVRHVVQRSLSEDRLQGVKRIGIDEFSYRKRHRYVTTVVDHDTSRIIWAGKGRGADTLGEFFDLLGEEGVAKLELATIDMAGGYKKALAERAPHVKVVFDRFHVQRLSSVAVDEVRRGLWRQMQGTAAGKAIKGSRFILLKRSKNLSRKERAHLSSIQHTNKKLYRAYLLKESLAAALDYKQPARARRALDDWLAWASRSRLPAFVKCAKTIRAHKEGILGYIRERMTNAVVEGFNTRMRMVARRAYGFHSSSALIGMMYLCLGGVDLKPPLPSPT